MELLRMLLGNGLLTSLGVVAGILLNRVFTKQDRKDEVVKLKEKVAGIEAENCLLCYGISACLDGLEQLGANHSVSHAKEKLEKYLNEKAHGQED